MRVLKRWLVVLAVALVAVGLAPGMAQAEAPSASSSQPCPSLEGCYNYASMQSFYDEIIVLVEGFSAASYSAMPSPAAYYYIANGTTMPMSCDPGIADSAAFHFCGPDDSIYVGQDQLWSFYTINGDAAAAFGIAHEWGHHVQHVAGVSNLVDTPTEKIQLENQADCIGGAFLKHLNEQGMLEPDDYSDMASILQRIASAEGPERDHGTLEERGVSTQYGFDHGLARCSEFFPDAPLVT
ncbi:neutral zinc metallopeptidase [Geodermatophilus sp. URMC 61]|uniref:neutral zinc metallopeptidase n=1 Tax=Geodermatophilus sp. URMC 61 TaxID=3423411 RepID=UPI00406C5A68